MPAEHIHFVTGKLAEHALRDALARVAREAGFDYSVDVLGISVAALMTAEWAARRIRPPAGASRVILPGYCGGDLEVVRAAAGAPVERGPKDLRDLAEYFGARPAREAAYGAYDIEILAEINHAPDLPRDELLRQAASLAADGADVIDVGCNPGGGWSGAADAVRALRDAGHRVSIDSMDPIEVAAATRAGAELVLSVNAANRARAADWGVEVVVVPDDPASLGGLDESITALDKASVRFRIDPVIEPIGFGFAASLRRYITVRERYPQAEILMGVGNLTELTDVDSAGVNMLLLAICQELGVRSVLTTQVINWARSSVRECDVARRLAYYAVRERALPKRIEKRLLLLRDDRVREFGDAELDRMARDIKDHNFRLFAENDTLHALWAGKRVSAADPFALFQRIAAESARPISPEHAFYLGYELAKAVTALTLGKQYRQDEALDWGLLTREETSHRERRSAGGDGRDDA